MSCLVFASNRASTERWNIQMSKVISNDKDKVQEARTEFSCFLLDRHRCLQGASTVSIDHKFFFSVFVYLSFYCLVSFFSLVVRWQSNYFLHVLRCLLQNDALLTLVGSPTELSMVNIWFDEMSWLQQYLLLLTLRRLMSYIYGAPILDVSRSHTTTQHIR